MDRTSRSNQRPLVVTPEDYERGAVLRAALVSALRQMDRGHVSDVEWEEQIASLVLVGGSVS